MSRALLLALLPLAGSPAALAQGMDHAMPGMEMPAPAPPAPPPPSTPPPTTPATPDADEPRGTDQPPGSAEPPPVVHDPAAMAMPEHGGGTFAQVRFDLAEVQVRHGQNGLRWDGEAWIGGDIDRLVVRSEGDADFGKAPDHAEAQALYRHALDPWWNLEAGIRQDFSAGPDRTHAVIGVEGLAPYMFEVRAQAFLSHKGEVTGRLEASIDQRITQALILQPRVEANLSAQDMPDLHTGAGLADAELGLRLRYAIAPEFAPYIGYSWSRKFGRTADYARAAGEDPARGSMVIGLRAWF